VPEHTGSNPSHSGGAIEPAFESIGPISRENSRPNTSQRNTLEASFNSVMSRASLPKFHDDSEPRDAAKVQPVFRLV
jgi:hypothetical protein